MAQDKFHEEIYCCVYTKEWPDGKDVTPGEWDIIPESTLHRLDGPAEEFMDGYGRWWIEGNLLPKKEVETWIKENNIDLSTEQGQMAFKIRFS